MGACIRKRVVYDMSCKRFQFFVNVEALDVMGMRPSIGMLLWTLQHDSQDQLLCGTFSIDKVYKNQCELGMITSLLFSIGNL